jgi:DegV family protein with EDD domain
VEIITNPGSNVLPEVVAHYGLHLAPQRIIAGGVEHDTRVAIPNDVVDGWVKSFSEFPYVVGTSAQEFALLFQALGKIDPEILVVTSSRKIIQSHAAATAAARSVAGHAASKHLRIGVVDSGMTDAAAGLVTIMAGEAKRAGLGLRETVTVLERVAMRSKFFFIPGTLDNLVKGGRAGWTRAFLADILRVRPILSFVDGELKNVGTVSVKEDQAATLAKLAERVGGKRPVWISLLHPGSSFREGALAGEIRRTMNVQYMYAPPLNSSIYLHVGAGSLGVAVLPIDDLPWSPTLPPPF